MSEQQQGPQQARISLESTPADPSARDYSPPAAAVPLPSRGKVYPAESPLSGQASVEVKAMTAKEEDILTSRALLKQGKAISVLMRSCLVNKSVDPDAMLVGDRNAVLVAIRIGGYGPRYGVTVQCPACEEKMKHEFDLGRLPLRMLDADPVAPGSNQFEYVLPVTGRKAVFKLLTGADEAEIARTQEKTRKALGPGIDNSVTLRLFAQLLAVDGEQDRQRLSQLVRNMPAGDSLALRQHIDDISPGIDMVQLMACTACGEETEVDVPMGTEFFWPGKR